MGSFAATFSFTINGGNMIKKLHILYVQQEKDVTSQTAYGEIAHLESACKIRGRASTDGTIRLLSCYVILENLMSVCI